MKAVVVCALCLLAVFVAVQPAEIFTHLEQWDSCEKARNLKEISSEIWKADCNRLFDEDLEYNDNPPNVDPKLFKKKGEEFENKMNAGTYGRLRTLLECYNTKDIKTECRTHEEGFLKEIMKTKPIKCLLRWLAKHPDPTLKELAPPDKFEEKLKQSWFHQYNRDGCKPPNSNGFRHTFVGEICKNYNKWVVKGFHNWVQAYYEEDAGKFKYKGYKSNCWPDIASFSFDWTGPQKETGSKWENSMFMRTSPEVEIALYTLCFLVSPSQELNGYPYYCYVSLNGIDVKILAWSKTVGVKTTIGSAYPIC